MRNTGTQYHIGRTFYSYQVSGKLLVIGYALRDGFGDPNVIKEYDMQRRTGKKHVSDRKGPDYELGGTPYDYIPTVILLKQ